MPDANPILIETGQLGIGEQANIQLVEPGGRELWNIESEEV